ncbi:MAG: phosphoglycerate kinase [Elusimicrobia bacterium CG_4_9_14_3_um_filter_62_55]|nr:MAG: phosphoglycerate kinase [Elusimicrobia bacterium CG22_combo_CG10-13_8_21_14_all_63_91]PJA13508.1 MAG: phosphoglycerate kinase [Elusimicrobia bacterium CG_4_10_14_0_2_um_filter_63_34]PJB25403.1 MAG: phosphoglycerate kinase [Elusimicrobia bacterium CG_4_9_14_3_um_filter_62_55]
MDSLEVSGKTVLVRVDYNVPLDGTRVVDPTRIESTILTLKALLERGAKLVLIAHLGRPKGQRVEKYSLKPVVAELERCLGRKVVFAEDCVGNAARTAVDSLQDGGVALLENLRFHAEEEKNDPKFARELASLGDCFVQDAFGAMHRAHASTAGIPALLPSAAGLLVEKELKFLTGVMEDPHRPYVAVLGGAKVSDKLAVTLRLLESVDAILIGGGMAYTFLHAQGIEVGKSLLEKDRVEDAKGVLKKAAEKGVEILLPSDHLVAAEFKADSPVETTRTQAIPADKMGLDIGPATIELFAKRIRSAKTIFWNGPMGVFEMDAFAKGSIAAAEAMAAATAAGATTVVGGGDSLAVLKKTGLGPKMTHCSTGGGASLEFLEGKLLPGVAALAKKRV